MTSPLQSGGDALTPSPQAVGVLTIREARRQLVARLRAAGGDTPILDARLLVEAVAGAGAEDDALLGEQAAADLDGYVARRLAGEPVWRILGEREFWGLTFKLSPATLEPRPDTETLVEAAVHSLRERRGDALSVLDLGTGTGCLLIAILSEFRQARGLGIDLSGEACKVAAANALANGVGDRVAFREGDWVKDLEGRFDLIVSNPPYIPGDEIPGLDVAVRAYDPLLALDGGIDGLVPYRLFARELTPFLAPGGIVIFEIGAGQEPDVSALMRAEGFRYHGARKDLGGHERALIFSR